MESGSIKLNIQPNAGIMNIFDRLNYTPWYAIAEFVDNATQSFYNNKDKLEYSEDDYRLVINIEYDSNKNTLTIKDNAYGMEIDDFKRAVTLDAKNENQKGRNEFGMGLKTAACWFGKKRSVLSTELGSNNEFYTEVNVEYLKENNINFVDIKKNSVDSLKHGTIIKIENLTKKLSASRTIGKIRSLLASMYRRDIAKGNVDIYFNGEKIFYEDLTILNFRNKYRKKDLDFSFEFEEKTYRVTGFVGIMNKGSFAKGGFALFRNDRVVVGGDDMNYKPDEIFQFGNSQISLKLFGELNMNDFPVSQAKDGFIWFDGLEDEFIKNLKFNISDYIEIGKMSIKDRISEEDYSDKNSDEVHNNTQASIDKIDFDFNQESSEKKDEDMAPYQNLSKTDVDLYQEVFLNENKNNIESIGKPREYIAKLSGNQEIKICISWASGNNDQRIKIDDFDKENNTLNVLINIDHPFFKPYSKENQFKIVLEKLVFAFAYAEEQAKKVSEYANDGYIQYFAIRNNINRILRELSRD